MIFKKVEDEQGIDLNVIRKSEKNKKVSEYEQFESELRQQAARMSEFYEVFYCLENSIRKLVKDIMVEAQGADW